MEHKKQKKKVVKPKNRFTICCFCLNSSSSEIELRNSVDGNEPYDYVVEKLAIKKVPISLFATDEDLEEMQNINFGANTAEYRYTPKDKKSAMIFSSCYSKIPKNVKGSETENENKLISVNKDLPYHKSQENQSIIESNITESYKDICTQVITEKEVRDISPPPKVTAEVYSERGSELNVPKKFLKMTPQLQETLNALGSKQRPTGSPSVKHKRVLTRANPGTTNIVSPVTIDRRCFDKARRNLPAVIKESEETSRNDDHRQNILKQMLSAPHKPVESRAVDEHDLPNDQRQGRDINAFLNSLASKAAANQKWKIIIKEHEDEEGGDDGTTHKSTESGSEYGSDSETIFETE